MGPRSQPPWLVRPRDRLSLYDDPADNKGDAMRSMVMACLLGLTWFAGMTGCDSGATGGGDPADGGSMGDGGSAGDGGSTVQCTPEGAFDGAPVTAPAGKWQWVPVPETKCRNGSATGFGVRINPNSDQLVIYLQGGGACFNGTTCAINPSQFSALEFAAWSTASGSSGFFDSSRSTNPLSDWNMVFIPYCTGDVHQGNAPSMDVPGLLSPKKQAFVGYANIGYDLKRIVPTFPNVRRVLLTGESAGGFGATFNYDRIAQAFCPKEVLLLDDSGPAMSDTYLAPCLQARWRQLWNFAATLPAACTACSAANGGGLVNLTSYLAAKYPTAHLGLISSTQDSVISAFFGYGQNSCSNIDGVTPVPLSGTTFTAGLNELRQNNLAGSSAWSSYYINSVVHTYIGGAGFYGTTVSGVKLNDWVSAFLSGTAMSQVGP